MLTLAIAVSAIGGVRDNEYVKNWNSSTLPEISNLDNDNCNGEMPKSIMVLVGLHDSINGLLLLTDLILRCAVIVVCTISVSEWKDTSMIEYAPIKGFDAEKLNTHVITKGYKLYRNYAQIGRRNREVRDILKHWFVLQYSVYLLSVMVELVHILKPVAGMELKRLTYDTWHSILYLVFDFLAFLVPYFAGIMLNNAHRKYHETMMEKYYEEKIEGVICNLEKDDMKESIKETYMKYYNVALMNSNILNLKEKFDFVPSLFNITIPLDNPGYTFTILLVIPSVVFNFTAN